MIEEEIRSENLSKLFQITLLPGHHIEVYFISFWFSYYTMLSLKKSTILLYEKTFIFIGMSFQTILTLPYFKWDSNTRYYKLGTFRTMKWNIWQILSLESNYKTRHDCQNQQFQGPGNGQIAYTKLANVLTWKSPELQVRAVILCAIF